MAQRTSTTDRVFASLRESILTGEFPAGSLHSIYRLADLLEVSRTPVREAVLRLADVGLVAIERNRGVRIRGVTVQDVRSVFELRLLIEVPATAYAAAYASTAEVEAMTSALEGMRVAVVQRDEPAFTGHDRALHAAVGAVLGNDRLLQELTSLRDSIQTRGASTLHRSRGMSEVLEEHVPIVEAISARDPDEAAGRMESHLVSTATLLMRQAAAPGEAVDPDWATRLRDLHGARGRGRSAQ